MGREELASDERYATHAARGKYQSELDELIAQWTRTLEIGPLEDLLNEHGVPCGLIYRAPEMLEDPHFKAREAIVDVPHPAFGMLKMQNVAPKLSATPGKIRHAGPELGQHNDDVYKGILQMAESKIEDYQSRGII